MMTNYMQYIALSRYARWDDALNRRETWTETVDRYFEFWKDKGMLKDEEIPLLTDAIVNLEVMPSMRCLMTAGPALNRDNVAGFNCSYLPIDHVRAFDELMYVLMNGTGVGFTVERQYIAKLPEIDDELHPTATVIHVADSKIGWAASFRELISLLYAGHIPKWDMSKIRPAGARLKTFGGRASGPDPLHDLFMFTTAMFKRAAGRRLTSIECHDLCCKIAEIVVVGGVRRSALISLSNLTDDRMRRAKNGQWWLDEPQRALANNSTCYTEQPDFESFLKEWTSLYESKAGERGIFSRLASKKQAAKSGRRDVDHEFGTNPCSEIILRPNQFCNLSEVVIRSGDTLEELAEKVRIATIFGSLQSTLTNFRYLRKIWERNTEEESLLGVSFTGIMDHPVLNGGTKPKKIETFLGDMADTINGSDLGVLEASLEYLKGVAVATNKEWADRLGVEQSAAITCVKPSGTVSQLVDCASGIHTRFSKYYIRRVRADIKDPLATMMKDQGVPWEVDSLNPSVVVFSFPQSTPDGAIYTQDVSAMDQMRLWKIYQDHWCEHKPSITVYYKDSEFLEVGQWLFNNMDTVSGVSFLPHTDHTYVQAPYEEIDEITYKQLTKEMPVLDWDKLAEYELTDHTEGSQTLACVANNCEI